MNWLHVGSYSNSVGPSCIFERIAILRTLHSMSQKIISLLTGAQVLLISWMDTRPSEFDMLDLFSGQQAISRVWFLTKFQTKRFLIYTLNAKASHWWTNGVWVSNYLSIHILLRTDHGFKCASFDIDLNPRTMDFLSAPGFVPLRCRIPQPKHFSKTISHCNMQNPWYVSVYKSYYSKKTWNKTYCWNRLIYEVVLWNITQNLNFKVYSGFQKRNIRCVPRLALWIGFNMHPNAIACMGPDCSSWGLPARGSSLRSFVNIFGNVFSSWVQRSSTMITRLLAGINYICHVYWPVKFKN